MNCKTVPVSLVLFLCTFFSFSQSSTAVDSLNYTDASTNSILANTANSEKYKTLLSVMRAADMEEILGFDGPFTVFAPSNSAFEKLSKNKIAELLRPENKKKLHDLMTYHIVAGNFSASKILLAMCRGEGSASFTTVQGDEITATMQGVDIVLTDNLGNTARIMAADSNQCNGVMHEIDSVIRPSKI